MFHPNLSSVTDLTITGDLTVNGNLNFGDAGTDILTVAGYIQGSGGGAVKIGNGTPNAFLSQNEEDLYITGELEVDGIIHGASGLRVTAGLIYMALGSGIAFNGTHATRGGYNYRTDEGSYLVAGSLDGHGNHQLSLISGDNETKDHDRDTKATNPTFNFFSATDPDTDNTEYGTATHDTADFALGAGKGGVRINGVRLKEEQGADVASANNLTLGTDGNTFEITGTTQINLIDNTAWFNGNIVTLLFTSTPTVKHGQATSGSNVQILLAGAADFAATAGDTLTLRLCEIGGTQAWREIARAAI